MLHQATHVCHLDMIRKKQKTKENLCKVRYLRSMGKYTCFESHGRNSFDEK